MATIRLDLTSFKASGIYTLEFDASESIQLNTQTIRLIVGFSRKGPFNAPVYLPDKKTAENVYGKIDPFLEKLGSYFHRSLSTALDVGPVFGLNLMPLNNDEDFGDKVPYYSYSLSTTEPNGKKVSKLYSSFYNKERFWFPDQEYFLGNVNSPGSVNTGKLFNVVNLGQTPVSILTKKAKVEGFALTAREWYGVGNVPTYIDEFDLIEDYFIEMYVVAGNWTNYKKLSVDTTFGKYFDRNGLKKGKDGLTMETFLGENEVNVIGRFVGCVLPDFEYGGQNLSIDIIVNNQIAGTGIFVSVDKKALENYDIKFANSSDYDEFSAVDMVGHNFAAGAVPTDPRQNPDVIDFLSYKTCIKENVVFDLKSGFEVLTQKSNSSLELFKLESVHLGKSYGYLNNILCLLKPDSGSTSGEFTELEYLSLKNSIIPGQSLVELNELDAQLNKKYGIIQQVYEEDDTNGKTWLKLIYTSTGKSDAINFTADGKSFIVVDKNASHKAETDYTPDYIIRVKASDLSVDAAPSKGLDILVENVVIKDWYYFKVKDVPFESTVDTVNYIDIPVEADADLELFTTSIGNYKLFVDETKYVVFNGISKGTLTDADVATTGSYFVGNATKVTHTPNSLSLTITGAGTKADGVGNTVYDESKLVITKGLLGSNKDDHYIINIATSGQQGTGAGNAQITVSDIDADQLDEIFDNITAGGNSTSYNCYIFTKSQFLASGITTESSISFVLQPDKIILNSATGTNSLGSVQSNILAYKYSKLYKYYEDGALQEGDKWFNSKNTFVYLDYEETVDTNSIPVLKITAYDSLTNGVFANASTGTSLGFTSFNNSTSNFTQGNGTANTSGLAISVASSELSTDVKVLSTNQTKTKFVLKPADADKIQPGHYVVAAVKDEEGQTNYKLTKVLLKVKQYNAQLDSWAYEYTVSQPVYVDPTTSTVIRFLPMDDFIQHYQMVALEGFKITSYHLPSTTKKNQQLEKILGMLDPQNSNLMQVLKSKDVITFRYVVDTFDGGLEPMTGAKRWLTKLAQQRQKCLALVNLPSIKEFIASTDPRFTELPTKVDPKPILSPRYIADGGNLSLGPSYTFSLVDEDWGAKFAGYFGPFMVIRENGKNMAIPPAAHVSNLFVMKFIKGQPFSIVAGPRRGIISEAKMVGLEYDFLDEDRVYLEPMGINPIIKKKGVGYMIYANQMAYQRTKTAFNNLHVRDLLITIEEAIEDVLANYMFEFNDPNTRLEIKTIVESYLDGVRSAGGIYNYTVQMDESNNPPEVRDANTAILDVSIEPARGIHKFISRVTVHKTGGIGTTSFTFA